MREFFALLLALPLGAQTYDLLLKGGHVIDPRNNVDGLRDVAITAGRIAAVAPAIDASQARRTLDVRGLYVTPGLIDLHVHLFATTGVKDAWAGDNSILPDGFSFRTGVTTMVDAGSSGWRNFETFRHTVIDRARTRVLALINIAGLGMMTDFAEQPVHDMNSAEVARLAKKHRDVVVGVKSAHFQGPGWESVDRAVEAGRLASIPIMVDFGYFLKTRPYWQLVTDKLRAGDMSTHCYRGPVPIADENGKLYDYLLKARARGVKFDVGHGGGSFTFRNAFAAISNKFYPDSISTDLHTGSMNGPMFDMPSTMSKLMAIGLPLQEAVRASTWNPAQQIQRPDLGHLSGGAVADIAVFRLQDGDFGFADSSRGAVKGKQRLVCELTVKDGQSVFDWNSRNGVDWKTLPKDYGIRPVDLIIPPPK
ncbi:MAG: amidohydrolase/deacetylase family metallohydrolase [Candidatus Solibacter usitatus]|nr:amidohydrolase/deacetylase family metallohydrolase [Candidatus Solibacter usitatus]